MRHGSYEVTPAGAALLARLDVDAPGLAAGRRAFARRCLDWTERRHHLAGAVGAAMLDALLARRWLAQRPDSRALRLTDAGAAGFGEVFGLDARAVLAEATTPPGQAAARRA